MENDSQTYCLHSCLCLLVSSFRFNKISFLIYADIYMSNDLISDHTSLTFRVPLTCIFLIDPLHILHTNQAEIILLDMHLSGENCGFTSFSRNSLLRRLHLKTAPLPPPHPCVFGKLVQTWDASLGQLSRHSTACKAIIYRRLVFCLTSV